MHEAPMRIAVVKAAYDDDAGVWFVEHSDVGGASREGEIFEAFRKNVADATNDLLSEEGDGDILIEIVAHASVRAPRCGRGRRHGFGNWLIRRRGIHAYAIPRNGGAVATEKLCKINGLWSKKPIRRNYQAAPCGRT